MSQEEKNKKLVDVAKKTLLSMGYSIKTTHLYELFAKLGGYNHWSVAKSKQLDISQVINKFLPQNNFTLDQLKNFDEAYLKKEYQDKFFLGKILEKNKPFIVDMEKSPNLLIAGSMGTGKSESLMSSLLVYLVNNSEKTSLFLVNTLKDMYEYDSLLTKNKSQDGYQKKYPQISEQIETLSKFTALLAALENEYNERIKIFKSINTGKISEYEKFTGRKINRCLIVIEEFNHLLNMIDFKDTFKTPGTPANKLWILLKVGRSVGIWFLTVSQQANAAYIPPIILGNFLNKLISQVPAPESHYLIGSPKASNLKDTDKGQFISNSGELVSYNYLTENTELVYAILQKYMKSPLGSLLSESLQKVLDGIYEK